MLFKPHADILAKHSEFFSTLFSLPQPLFSGRGNSPYITPHPTQQSRTFITPHGEGSSDANPIKIPSVRHDDIEMVSSQDFESFLRYVYDR